MSDVTQILSQIESGDPKAADELLPLVYEELRKLAAQKIAQEKPGQTLQATALVHEAYLRLVGREKNQHWNNRGHFFVPAAEAMRRILVETARRKNRLKHGGGVRRVDIDEFEFQLAVPSDDLLAVDEAVSKLQQNDPQAAQLVKLRFFAGMEHVQAAEMLGISRRVADRLWLVARAWLLRELGD